MGEHVGNIMTTGASVSTGTATGDSVSTAIGAAVTGTIGATVTGTIGAAVRIDGLRVGETGDIGDIVGNSVGEVVSGRTVIGAIEGTKGHIFIGGSPKSLFQFSRKTKRKSKV
jgi:hypothetical protein